MQTVRKYFISLIISNKVRKKTAFLRFTANQVGTGQSSIYSQNIQLGINSQQSTANMALARLSYNADISKVFNIIDTIISGQEKDSFALLYLQASRYMP